MPGHGGNNEAQGREAPVLSAFGLWVEHMLNHNMSHQNATFLKARGQSFLQVGEGRECCGWGLAGKVSQKRTILRGGGNST